MKTLLFLFVSLSAVLISGCASTNASNLKSVLNSLPAISAVDVTQSTTTPVYSHSETLTGLDVDKDGNIIVTKAKASITLPLLGTQWDLSVSSLKITPAQKTALANPIKP